MTKHMPNGRNSVRYAMPEYTITRAFPGAAVTFAVTAAALAGLYLGSIEKTEKYVGAVRGVSILEHIRSGVAADARREMAMADKTAIWNNAVGDGDLDNANNWLDATKPDAVDTWFVIFDGDINNTAPTSNLGVPVSGSWAIKKWVFRSSYTAGIGSSGTPLEIGIISNTAPELGCWFRNCRISGRGTYYIESESGTPTGFIIDCPRTTGTSVYLDGTIGYLFAKSGTVVVDGAAACTYDCIIDGGAYITLTRGAETQFFPRLTVRSGTLITDRDSYSGGSEALIIAGGEVRITGILKNLNPATQYNNVILTGGRLEYNPTSEPAATDLPRIWAVGGVLDLSKIVHLEDFTSLIIGPNCDVLWPSGPLGLEARVAEMVDLRLDDP